jgi:L-galactose dehydrogenase
MEQRPLGNTGLDVSVLSFGGSSLGGVFHDIDEGRGVRCVHVALDHGINYIDTSPYYGDTKAETVLGRALQEIDRDRYYLATKVGQYGQEQFDFSRQRVLASVDESLARLHVDHIDLIQCHDIEFADLHQIVNETLPALHELKATGKVRHVGVTGLPLRALERAVNQGGDLIEAVLSFCHYELNDTSLQSLIPMLSEQGIGIINASPTGMGLLTERGAPSWHPAPAHVQACCREAVGLCAERGWDIVELAIQFALANPDIATTLVGTANPDNMRRNIEYAERQPDWERIEAVRQVLAPVADHNFTRGREENRDPIVGGTSA